MTAAELRPVLPADDLLQPFQVEGANLRGRLIRLGPVVDRILARHEYPEPVSILLGQALVLAAALAGALKFDGIFTLQTKSDGPISTLVADYRTPGALRGYAGFDRSAFAPGSGLTATSSISRLLGAGYLAFTVDQGAESERYQGIVELAGGTLAECAHRYFQQSEQLEAGIRLAVGQSADADGKLRWRAGGIMVQRLPQPGLEDEAGQDAWTRAMALLGTARDQELCDPALGAPALLYRLFHEDGVRIFTPQGLSDTCRCSRERVRSVLRSFPPEEISAMVVEGSITATCEFCNTAYRFAPDDVMAPE